MVNNQAWNFFKAPANTGLTNGLGQALMLMATNDLNAAKQAVPTGTWYIQIRYMILNADGSLVNNVDIAKTTN